MYVVLVILLNCFNMCNCTSVTKVAVLDIETILNKSKAAVFIAKKAEEKRTELQKVVEIYEKQLRSEESNLKKINKKDLKNYKKAKEDFDKSTASIHDKVNSKYKLLRQIFHNISVDLKKEVFRIASDYAKKNAISAVIPKNFAIYSCPQCEITEQILLIIDTQMPTIKIKFPELKVD